jgi:hypothetical protein
MQLRRAKCHCYAFRPPLDRNAVGAKNKRARFPLPSRLPLALEDLSPLQSRLARSGHLAVSVALQHFLQELDRWTESTIIGPLFASETDGADWEPAIERVKKAIRARTLQIRTRTSARRQRAVKVGQPGQPMHG